MEEPDFPSRYEEESAALEAALAAQKEWLREHAIEIDPSAQVSGRVKSLESIIGKAYRKAGEVRSWESFGDLVALKAIFPTQRGVEQFTRWMLAQGPYLPSLDRKEGKPHELKYTSMQFDLVSPDRVDSRGNNLKFEVQVRSAAVDAWYVVDHRLQYKGLVELPANLQRKLYRLIALTELFDDEVESVLTGQEELPSYASARLYKLLSSQMQVLRGGEQRVERAEGLFELLIEAYAGEEMPSLADTVARLVESKGDSLRILLQQHSPGSEEYVQSRDWIYSEPEALLIAERALHKPELLRARIQYSDFEVIISPMIEAFRSGLGV